jgi:hypothetical protein
MSKKNSVAPDHSLTTTKVAMMPITTTVFANRMKRRTSINTSEANDTQGDLNEHHIYYYFILSSIPFWFLQFI